MLKAAAYMTAGLQDAYLHRSPVLALAGRTPVHRPVAAATEGEVRAPAIWSPPV